MPGPDPRPSREIDRDLVTGAERRRYFRLNKIMPARLEELSPDGQRTEHPRHWRVRILDISAGGFRASHPSSISCTNPLLAEIFLHPTHPVRAACRIRWDRVVAPTLHEVGCEFADVEAEDWKRLVDFIVLEQTNGGDGGVVGWMEEE